MVEDEGEKNESAAPETCGEADLPVRLGALLLIAGEGRAEERLLEDLRVAHAFGPLRDAGSCRARSREILRELRADGSIAAPEQPAGPVAITEGGRTELVALLAQADALAAGLAGHIRQDLLGGVGLAQARMFADRAAAVLRLVAGLEADPRTAVEARLLRVTFGVRVAGRLSGPAGKRARDVRDQIDFFYSRAAVLRYREVNRDRPRRVLREDVRWRTVRRGVAAAQVRMHLRRGPMFANLLRVDPRKVVLRAVDARGGRDEERSLSAIVRRFGAQEGTSGGFFLYSEDDLTPPLERGDPVGLLVSDGEVLSPPLFNRAALLIDERGHAHIRRVPLRGTTVRWDGGQVVLRSVNRPRSGRAEIIAYSRAFGAATPAGCGRTVTIVHRRVVASGAGGTAIPLLGLVLAFPDASIADPIVASLAEGTPVRYALAATPGEAPVDQAIAGGPLLLDDGRLVMDLATEDFLPGVPPVTFSGDASIGMNLLPRLAWGQLPDHHLVAVAVDGRNLRRSIGESLDGMGRLMRSLGCQVALNFDGGSSKRICVEGEEIDLSTTALVDGAGRSGPRRPIHTAWVVSPRETGRSAPASPPR